MLALLYFTFVQLKNGQPRCVHVPIHSGQATGRGEGFRVYHPSVHAMLRRQYTLEQHWNNTHWNNIGTSSHLDIQKLSFIADFNRL